MPRWDEMFWKQVRLAHQRQRPRSRARPSTGIFNRTTGKSTFWDSSGELCSHASLHHAAQLNAHVKHCVFLNETMFLWKSLGWQARFTLCCKKPVKHYPAGAESPEWGRAGLQLASAQLHRGLQLPHRFSPEPPHIMRHCKCSGLGKVQRKMCPLRGGPLQEYSGTVPSTASLGSSLVWFLES